MNVRRTYWLATAALLAGGLPLAVGAQSGAAETSGGAGGMCIPAETPAQVTACPSNAPAKRSASNATAPRSQLKVAKRQQEAKKQQPRGPSVELDAATRQNRERIQVRQRQLLQREVQVLNRLVGNTRAADPRRPDVLLRLAETYFEMQQDANTRVRSFDEPMFQARRERNQQRVRQLEQQQRQAQEELDQARRDAIATYARLVQDHADYRRMDEVLFSLGYALEEMREFDRARQVYHRLIKGFPQSRFIPNAYLSFAEYYFAEGEMENALQFYQKVTEFPPERNPVYGFAVYKQAWAYYNVEQFREALQKFVETIEFAQQNPEANDAANLARQSRRELVLPYSRVGRVDQALDFFSRYSQNREQALETFEALGELYYDTGEWRNTLAVYQKLMAEEPSSDKVCYWQSRVTNAIISSRPKAEQVTEVQRLIDTWETFTSRGGHSAESMQQCKAVTASVLVELATAWHREAVGTDSQPGTNNRDTMQLATRLYRLVIEKFPDMEEMEFPEIAREDWPTQYKVAYFYAELLWKMEDWGQCGPAFDRVVELNPQGEFTSDAAYAAVLCYNNLYQQNYQQREREVRGRGENAQQGGRRRGRRGEEPAAPVDEAARFAPREFTELERGMLNAFQRYVCFVPDSEELPTIKYRRARIYYEANHYEEAALIFKDIATNHRASDLSVYAANLYLDSLNVLGTHRQPRRTACYDEIEQSIEPMFGSFCGTPENLEANSELCDVLQQLRCDILRKKAEAHQENREFPEAARIYVDIFRRYRECGRLDEVLWNAAINFEAARLVGRAIRVRTVLVERFAESEWAKRALFLLGANYHALAIYGKAAEYYEQFAARYPGELGASCTDAERTAGTCANASEALQNAVFFRLGLGEADKAIEDARLFERNYRTRLARETSQVVFSLGSIYERQENWNRVIEHYRDYLRGYGRQALPHELVRANVEIGKAYLKLEDRTRAEPFFRDALAAWQRGGAERLAGMTDVSEEERAVFLARAKEAVAEAIFYQSEYLFEAFRRVRFPEYRGGRDLNSVNRWAQREFVQWIEQKRTALQAAETSYNRLAAEDLAVPQWQIAGASRVGEMYASFIDAFRTAPVPQEIENDDELYGAYVDALEEQARRFEAPAIEKFEFCLITATRVRWFNEYSQTCERELNRLAPQRYPMAAELRGSPTYIFSAEARPGVVQLGATTQDDDLGGSGQPSSAVPGGAQQ